MLPTSLERLISRLLSISRCISCPTSCDDSRSLDFSLCASKIFWITGVLLWRTSSVTPCSIGMCVTDGIWGVHTASNSDETSTTFSKANATEGTRDEHVRGSSGRRNFSCCWDTWSARDAKATMGGHGQHNISYVLFAQYKEQESQSCGGTCRGLRKLLETGSDLAPPLHRLTAYRFQYNKHHAVYFDHYANETHFFLQVAESRKQRRWECMTYICMPSAQKIRIIEHVMTWINHSLRKYNLIQGSTPYLFRPQTS